MTHPNLSMRLAQSPSSTNGRTSTKGDIENELLRLEELLDIATRGRPVANWDSKGGRVNRAFVV